MTGEQLYEFLAANLVQGQVIHISNRNEYHKFNNVRESDGALVFHIPNKKNRNKPNVKVITPDTLIDGRDVYSKQNMHLDTQWIKKKLQIKRSDCRVGILKNLVKMPECL